MEAVNEMFAGQNYEKKCSRIVSRTAGMRGPRMRATVKTAEWRRIHGVTAESCRK